MKDNKNSKVEMVFNKMSLFGFSICGGLVGIIMIAVSGVWGKYSNAISTIGQTVMSISISSLLLEWFGYVNYTRKRMCEILAEDEVIKVLDMKRKKELKSALIKNIYMPDKHTEDNSIATIVDDEMDKVLKGYYFDEYILYIDAYKITENNNTYIKKDIRITFNAKSVKGDKCVIETLLSMYLEPIQNSNLKPVELRKLVIDEKDVTDVFRGELESIANTGDLKETYSRMYYLGKNNKKFKQYMTFRDSVYVDMEYSTIVGMDDLMYSHQIDKACKHYCMHFNVKDNEFDTTVIGFGFMSLGNTKRQRCVKTNNGEMLRFLDWILPGDGVCVVLKEKK